MADAYLAFAGSHWAPMGGWDDHLGTFRTAQEARAAVYQQRRSVSWWQIVRVNGPADVQLIEEHHRR